MFIKQAMPLPRKQTLIYSIWRYTHSLCSYYSSYGRWQLTLNDMHFSMDHSSLPLVIKIYKHLRTEIEDLIQTWAEGEVKASTDKDALALILSALCWEDCCQAQQFKCVSKTWKYLVHNGLIQVIVTLTVIIPALLFHKHLTDNLQLKKTTQKHSQEWFMVKDNLFVYIT